ncbi:MAG TPA: uroporphyrinogen-III synthase [Candidatus Dormibacteraeota bacterium]|nr:uroporphyrinogen-III synthase [Candidatus Dormibacteraeota bacterium]
MTAVLLTRPLGAEDPLAIFLGELGYRVHAVPTLATEPVRVAAESLAGFDWIVVTSAAGVAALPELPTGSRWAAVGAATAAALAERGVTADLVPEVSNGAAIAAAIPGPAGSRVLLARADAAAEDLPVRLRELGAEVVELAVYRTVEAPPDSRAALAEALADPDLAGVVFASGSAVRGFLGLGGTASLPAVTIGPRTSQVARDSGFKIAAEAAQQTTRELAEAVARAFPSEV